MILGLISSHNATVCLLDEATGAVPYAASEERFSRRKNEWGIPRHSLQYALDHIASPAEITAVAVGELYEHPYGSTELARILNLAPYAERDRLVRTKWGLARVALLEVIGQAMGRRANARVLLERELRGLGIHAPIHYHEHHHAHAASAFYGSPFEDALILTLDGEGDGRAGSVWKGGPDGLTQLYSFDAADSVGLFYKSVTAFGGLRINRDEGKLMALAGKGDPARFYDILKRILWTEVTPDGPKIHSTAGAYLMQGMSRSRVDVGRFVRHGFAALTATAWEPLWNRIFADEIEAQFGALGLPTGAVRTHQDLCDIAAAAQKVAEEAVVGVVKACLAVHPAKNLAVAGGVFANVCINAALIGECGLDSLYVHPGMGDEGLAFGAAALYAHTQGKTPRAPLGPVYLGPDWPWDPPAGPGHWTAPNEEALIEAIADALAANRVVGLCRGRMEYGPRALGHRSILTHPDLPGAQASLNKRLNRTSYMPFAPIMIDTWYDEMFVGREAEAAKLAARYMTVALPVQKHLHSRLTAVVHEDGTARPQRVCREDDPFLYALMSAFQARTGIGCLLNTSFNRHNEPIICRPEEALDAYAAKAVDLLVVGNTCYGRE